MSNKVRVLTKKGFKLNVSLDPNGVEPYVRMIVFI